MPPSRSITLIFSPYHLGLPNIGVANGPNFLRSRGLIPALQATGIPVREVEIDPVDDSSSFDGDIPRSFELLRRTSRIVARERAAGAFPIVLCGNCTASVGVAAGLHASGCHPGLGCVWLDAHDDYHTPDTMASGYFDAMPVAMLLGECWRGLLGTVPGHRVWGADRVAFVGLRDVTDVERGRVDAAGFDVVWGGTERRVDYEGEMLALLKRKRWAEAMVHLDLDCLDESLGKVYRFAAPGGLLEDDLAATLTAVSAEARPVALTVASFDPSLGGGDRIADIAIRSITKFVESLKTRGVLSAEP